MIVAIIPTRLQSMRFPGKALIDLCGKPALEHIVDRIRAVVWPGEEERPVVGDIILATTQCCIDYKIVDLARKLNVKSFMGDEYDPLNRMYRAALWAKAEHVIRITHDCCLIDPTIIAETIVHYFNEKADYCASRMDPTAYPDGMDVEIFSFAALAQAYDLAEGESREHVTPWIKEIGLFKCVNTPSTKTYGPEPKLCIDTMVDYKFIRGIYEKLHHKNQLFGLREIEEELGEFAIGPRTVD